MSGMTEGINISGSAPQGPGELFNQVETVREIEVMISSQGTLVGHTIAPISASSSVVDIDNDAACAALHI